MSIEYIQPLLTWIGLHPAVSGLIVFLIAFSESLAIVGLVMPGALLMVGLGTLIALGTLDFWPVCLAAIAGAIIGDGLSYWLGRHFQQRLLEIWPFKRFSILIERGTLFFQRHGGKSVLLGRFVGPVRPILPAIAGMMRMPVRRYLSANVASAIVWAPAYLLPGIVIGASVDMATSLASRLILFLIILVVLAWLSVLFVRGIYRFFQPRASAISRRILQWGNQHPQLGKLVSSILDPRHPEARGLFILALVLLGTTWLASTIVWNLLEIQPPTDLDQHVHNLIQGLRTPLADWLMILTGHLGSEAMLSVLIGTLTLWFAVQRQWKAVAHCLAAGFFAALAPWLLAPMLKIAAPITASGLDGGYSFPAQQALQSIVIYGFIGVILSRDTRRLPPWVTYAVLGLPVALISISGLYLGIHWLSDIAGGLTLGASWTALLGIAYLHHIPEKPMRVAGLAPVLSGLIIGSAALFYHQQLPLEVARLAPDESSRTITTDQWLREGWRQLPAYREDLRGHRNHPFNLQWMGDRTEIQDQLLRAGWIQPIPQTFGTLSSWLDLQTDAITLPILPQVHRGKHEALALIRKSPEPNRIWVLRLWTTNLLNAETEQRLWVGNISSMQAISKFSTIRYLKTEREFDHGLSVLGEISPDQATSIRRRDPTISGEDLAVWKGETLLIRPGDH